MSAVQSHNTLPAGVRPRQRSLSDGELWGHADSEEVGLFVPQIGCVSGGELSGGGPLLTGPADVLPFALADRTAFGRHLRVGLLHRTGSTDPGGHACPRSLAERGAAKKRR